ncbi:histidine phosphatase family protein [Alkalihalobacillus sp. LMS39]|uniref:histidine phosphatase family protein n=1 Tax=Alkalihalobacillus sp. LMS39 TaxID=2924032 RepID=UPI001FB3979D|nr:histidine phosphatase family protein [Alkalihalobacillus sp. LMS39]UOE95803.1 histidine phosphatase family protein [Alkalihalobacillus sp. LMS39]
MTTIGFIRHGVTEWNQLGKAQGMSNISLNEVGKVQALALGERLKQEEKWDIIASSDLSRANETATIIGQKLELPVSILDERFREMNGGKIEGTTEQERIQKWGENWRSLDLGMETSEQATKRMIACLHELIETNYGKRILVVSHGAVIGMTLRALMPDKFQKTFLDNTSVTILKFDENTWDCLLYNCTKHI